MRKAGRPPGRPAFSWHLALASGQPSLWGAPAAGARSAFESFREALVESPLEGFALKSDRDVAPRFDQIDRRREQRCGEPNRVSYGATDPGVELANEGGMHQRWP